MGWRGCGKLSAIQMGVKHARKPDHSCSCTIKQLETCTVSYEGVPFTSLFITQLLGTRSEARGNTKGPTHLRS